VRYCLRNKQKLINAFGHSQYQAMIESLSVHFKLNNIIDSYQCPNDDRFKLINVSNVRDTSTEWVFYIISITYDVYLLAYKDVKKHS
jgi:hypothetical protein